MIPRFGDSFAIPVVAAWMTSLGFISLAENEHHVEAARRAFAPFKVRIQPIHGCGNTVCVQSPPRFNLDFAPTVSRLDFPYAADLSTAKIGKRLLHEILPPKQLVSLSLVASNLSDAHASQLQAFSSLKSLDISETEISSTGLSELPALPDLRILDISYSKADDKFSAKLRAFKNLQHLSIRGCSTTDIFWDSAASLKNLLTVDASMTALGNQGLAYISQCSTLRRLDISFTKVTSTRPIASLTELTSLKLAGLSIRVNDGVDFAKLKHLLYLDLRSTPIDDASFKRLAFCPNLQSLSVANTQLSRSAVDTLVSLPAITSLNIERSTISARDFLKLAQNSTLRHLVVHKNDVPQSAIEQFKNLNSLCLIEMR